jgi:hypothetical protein
MTLRQITLFSFPEGASPEYLARMSAGLAEMVRAIPEIVDASWGPDVSGNPANFGFALSLDFADRAALDRYKQHAAHRAFIAAFMREIPITKVRTQYLVATPTGAARP